MKQKLVLALFCLILPGFFVQAQDSAELPLRRVALLSSGVGFFQHSGNISGPAEISLPFDAASVNDALMSLLVTDSASRSPSVRYASENALWLALRSLRIDLSANPGIGEILNGQRGAELEVYAPGPIRGRIIGVEQVFHPAHGLEQRLMLFSPQGLRVIQLSDIASFAFIDEELNNELSRALELILASRDESSRNLLISLDGTGNRAVSLSYVIPTAVWKVSYRLDLGGREPLLQGWAIIDNDSDTDWRGVELSLLTGRPVSFIQQLYPPYRVYRPVLPLSIAGFAQARVHGGAWQVSRNEAAAESMDMMVMERAMPEAMASAPAAAPRMAAQTSMLGGGGVVETAAARTAGDQFEFTLRQPVNLERRQSAMLPLVEGGVRADRTLVFSGARARGGATIHPEISVELTNSSGMRLPAGPITVYDGGTYAGDALIEFFPENEKRLISYAEDLSVTGSVSTSGSRFISSVSIAGGVMIINHRAAQEWIYTINNASGDAKRIVIEHPVTSGAELAEPASADERTANLYRFNRSLGSRAALTFTVREETPQLERIVLGQLRPETFLSYSTNQEIPANVRSVLARAIELSRIAANATTAHRELERQRQNLVSEQDRIRRNLEAAGNQSPQGQEYLRRLSALDDEIDAINDRLNAAAIEVYNANQEYENYLATINIP